MISLRGVALATFLIISVVGDDFDSSFGDNAFGNSFFDSSFNAPAVDPASASYFHSSNQVQSESKSSGSSSVSNKKTVINADGTNSTNESNDAKGYNHDTNVNSETEELKQVVDGEVLNRKAAVNKSTDNSSDYDMKKSNQLAFAANGSKIASNSDLINNNTKSSALDQASSDDYLKNANGTMELKSGHTNLDEASSRYLGNQSSSDVENADGTYSKINNSKVSAAEGAKHSADNYSQFDSTMNGAVLHSKNGSSNSSETGKTYDQDINSVDQVNKDGTYLHSNDDKSSNSSIDKANLAQVQQYSLKDGDTVINNDFSRNASRANGTASAKEHSSLSQLDASGTKVDSVEDKSNSSILNASTDDLKNNTYSKIGDVEKKTEDGYSKANKDLNTSANDASYYRQASKNGVIGVQNLTSSVDKANSLAKDNSHSLNEETNLKTGEHKANLSDHKYSKNKTDASVQTDLSVFAQAGNNTISTHNKSASKLGTLEAKQSDLESANITKADGSVDSVSKGSQSRLDQQTGSQVSSNKGKSVIGGTETDTDELTKSDTNSTDGDSSQFANEYHKSANGTVNSVDQKSKQYEKSANSKDYALKHDKVIGANGSVVLNNVESGGEQHTGNKSSIDYKKTHMNSGNNDTVNDVIELGKQSELLDSGNSFIRGNQSVHNADGTFDDKKFDNASNHLSKDSLDTRSKNTKFSNKDGVLESEDKSQNKAVQRDSNSTVDVSHQAKNADGSSVDEALKSNKHNNSLSVSENALSSSKLNSSDGDLAISNIQSSIQSETKRAGEDTLGHNNVTNADGSKSSNDVSRNMDYALDGNSVQSKGTKYQSIGGIVSQAVANKVSQLKTGHLDDVGTNHTISDDGKGNVVNDEADTNTHAKIEEKLQSQNKQELQG